jgi:hypothetical protein
MNIEKLARKALTIIKLKYGLPKSGFVAGGSIANLMWELVSGNKAVVNDIDVFLYEMETPTPEKVNDDPFICSKPHTIKKIETSYFESYRQMSSGYSLKDSYTIKESSNNGKFNFVKYESKNSSPELIINSFDINCTQIGYSIDEDKFYYKDSFVDFLKSGVLKITNLNTPAHTTIRIVKKKNELNAILNDFEIEIAQYVLNNRKSFCDVNRVRFMQRYADMYIKNEAYLNKFFILKRDTELEEYLINRKAIDEKIFFLEPISKIIDSENLNHVPDTSSDFLFFIRNINNNPDVKDLWEKLYCVYTIKNYIEESNSSDDIEFISKFVRSYPDTINNLRGLTLSDQLYIIKSVIKKVSDQYDYNTAIAVLENVKFDSNKVFDDDECLLLGLSVRKKIKNRQISEIPF